MDPEKKTSKAESIIMYVVLGLTIIFGMIYLLTHDNCSRFNNVWEANIDTKYEVRIQVEDTAYALIDAYNANVNCMSNIVVLIMQKQKLQRDVQM